MLRSDSFKVVFGYLIICLIWGSTWLAIKIGLESLPPFLGAALRFSLAAIFMFSIVSLRGIRIPFDLKSLTLYIIVGVCSFSVGYALIYWGQQHVTSSIASILFGTVPFFVAGLSWFIFKIERLTITKAIGIVIGFLGVFVIFSEDVTYHIGEASFIGMIVIITAAAIMGFSSVMVKKTGGEISTFALNSIAMAIGSLILWILSYFTENWGEAVFDHKAVGSVLYLAIFGSVITFGIFFWLLKRMEAVILSLSAFITPIVALTLGVYVANEPFTIQLLSGTLLVLTGILIANVEGLKRINGRSHTRGDEISYLK